MNSEYVVCGSTTKRDVKESGTKVTVSEMA